MSDLSSLSDKDLMAALRQPQGAPPAGGLSQMSNADLMAALGKSAPKQDWGDLPSNIVPSSVELAKNIVHPIMHPIETAQSFAGIGKGLYSKAQGAMGIPQDPNQKAQDEAAADAIGQFFKDRYGSLDAAKQTIIKDPAGALSDVAGVLTGGELLAAKAPGLIGQSVRAAGAAGRAIDPVTNAVKLAGKGLDYAGGATANTVGALTGTGSTPLREAAAAGAAGGAQADAFLQNMRNPGATDVVQMAKDALDKHYQDRGNAYVNGMVDVKNDKAVLDFSGVDKALQDAIESVQFQGKIRNEARPVLQQLQSIVDEWRNLPPDQYHTPAGFDFLKKQIGDVLQAQPDRSIGSMTAGKVYDAVKQEIVKQAPVYGDIMKQYETTSNDLKEISKALSLGSNASKDTALRKLQSIMRNNVNTNYGARLQAGQALAEKAPELMPALAGQALSNPMPRGIQGAVGPSAEMMLALTGHPSSLMALPLSSPRLMGEAAYYGGKLGGGINTLANKTGLTSNIAPQLLYQTGRLPPPQGLLGQ